MVKVETNLIVHAVPGAALAGASGGAKGEYIAQQLYPGVDRAGLSEEQRQNISASGKLAAGLAGRLAGDSSGSAVTGAKAGKNAVENNSLSGDKARETVKQVAESLKDQVRNKLGEGKTSSISNAIINGLADTGDAALGSADYAADAAMALASCATGDGYCDRTLSDLSGKNQAVADSVKALMSSDTWLAVADTIKQASEGNQAALEATGGMLAGIILPGKKVPHVPNSGAVGNMGEFFKQSGFGNLAKESSQKSSQVFQGKSVYQAKNAIGEHISRGDKYYLDGLHKDHIEVFDSRGKVKAVLNLDGSYDQKKTESAIKEKRRFPK